MTEPQKLAEIISLLTFLQNYIQNNVKQSFNDLTFSLETVIKDYLNVFEKSDEQFTNINFLKHNYPAIDLENKKKSIGVQVTKNADLRKVKKTIDTYNRHRLIYTQLMIIGLVKSTKNSPPGVTVYDSEYLIELAQHGTSDQKDKVYDILKRQIPWNSLSPLDDKHCFDVVFDVINRSAVRDLTAVEGSFDKMVDGLSEIKEIITTGLIKGKSIRAKALVEYAPKIRIRLSEIEFDVSSIIQICNQNKNQRGSDFLCLKRHETDMIDKLKGDIINKTNKLADDFSLGKKIVGRNRW